MEIIEAVIQRYGIYTAALEREYVKSQQRAPEPPQTAPSESRVIRDHIAAFLQKHPEWWTMTEISRLLLIDIATVNTAIYTLTKRGEVTRQSAPVWGRRCSAQRYQWSKR